jgi:hypothetical protein
MDEFDDDESEQERPPPKPSPLLLPTDREGYDKSTWGDGPWQTEPDRVEWIFHGVPCLMIRHASWGSWNGYAGVEPGHKWHGKDRAETECNAHGGITYCGPVDEYLQMLSKPRSFKNVWWIGFDTGHAFDLMPGMRASLSIIGMESLHIGDIYRDLPYVTACTNAIALQIINARRH